MKKFFMKQKAEDKRSFFLEDELLDYILSSSAPADEIQEALIDATAELGWVSRMQISVDQGNLLTMLVKAIRPNFAVEIGTFTGFSAISTSLKLPCGYSHIFMDTYA